MKKIGIIFNYKKDYDFNIINNFINSLNKDNKIFIENPKTVFLNKIDYKDNIVDNIPEVDILIIFGGDGTILRACRQYIDYSPLFIGINAGKLGFLTELDISETDVLLNKINNDIEYTERNMFEVSVKVNNEHIKKCALNEIVFTRFETLRMIYIKVFIDNNYLNTFEGDGIIISTPTGSTGHSMSAFGPIINPELDVGLITPLNTHTLTNRPLIYGINQTVRLELINDCHDAVLFLDGQKKINVNKDSNIIINKYPIKARFIDLKKCVFFDRLRKKLNWRGNLL